MKGRTMRRLIAYAMAVGLAGVLSACGGGGGGSDDPGSTSPSNNQAPQVNGLGSLAGLVTKASGAPFAGVLVTLSGVASNTTITDANGAYSFLSLGAGSYVATPSVQGSTFSPASSAVAIAENAVTANFTQAANPSTQLIAGYASTLHAAFQTTFAKDEVALDHKLRSEGLSGGGTHYKQSAAAYVAASKAFADDLLAFVVSKAQAMPIDHDAVTAIFEGYRGVDVAFVESYYLGVNWGLSASGLKSFIADTQTSVSTNYTLTEYKLP
jgi:hypothetical protein